MRAPPFEIEARDGLLLFTPRRAALIARRTNLGILLLLGVAIVAFQFGLLVGGIVGSANEPFTGMDRAFGDYFKITFFGSLYGLALPVGILVLLVLPLHLVTQWGFRWFVAALLAQGCLLVPWMVWSWCCEIASIADPSCQIYDWNGNLVKPAWVSGRGYQVLGWGGWVFIFWGIGLLCAIRAVMIFRRLPVDDQPRCERCQYLLYGLSDNRCPECGEPFDRSIVEAVAPASEASA